MPGDFEPFFATQAGVAAALTGLVFVALSINLRSILALPHMAGRAGEALLVLLLPVLVGLLCLLPQSSLHVLGVEVLVVSLGVTAIVGRTLALAAEAATRRPPREFAVRVLAAGVATATSVVGAAALVAGWHGGLWLLCASALACVVAGVADAWVLLVEILR